MPKVGSGNLKEIIKAFDDFFFSIEQYLEEAGLPQGAVTFSIRALEAAIREKRKTVKANLGPLITLLGTIDHILALFALLAHMRPELLVEQLDATTIRVSRISPDQPLG